MNFMIYTKDEIANILGCSLSKLDSLMFNGSIKYLKYGQTKQSAVRFTSLHLSNYLKSVEV